MNQKVYPFLLMPGNAREAMDYYASVFQDSAIVSVQETDGRVIMGVLDIKGQQILFNDSVNGDVPFTTALSLFVTCKNRAEINAVFEALAKGGEIFMPLEPLPHAKLFGWVSDRYGVNWQLNLPLAIA